MDKKILEKIKDDEVRLAVTELLGKTQDLELELETARKTAKSLMDKAQKLEAVNTDLYAKVVAGTVDTNKQETEVKPKSLVEVGDDIAQKLRAKK